MPTEDEKHLYPSWDTVVLMFFGWFNVALLLVILLMLS